MDGSNYSELLAMAPNPEAEQKTHMLRSFDPDSSPQASVPDPYYGGASGFDDVFDICYAGCAGLLQHIRETSKL